MLFFSSDIGYGNGFHLLHVILNGGKDKLMAIR